MFKKFNEKEDVVESTQLKSSVQKAIRAKIVETYPHIENFMEFILNKKEQFKIIKCHDRIELIVNAAGEQLFFRSREGPWMPTLRLYHKFPVFLTKLQVDKGAIRFVLSGANIMCPGLTSPGAFMNEAEIGTVVAIMAEGKEHCLAIGLTILSTENIAKINKGIGVENCHYLNDGLWNMKPVK